ncbi:MAG: hydrolase 1, exosortase A system-associated [Rubrivivax sp.]|nr:hydrolase 1, exosortase A system-associated [Rubrivivax sp.]
MSGLAGAQREDASVSYTEHPLAFSCAGDTLLGVLSVPAAASPADIGILIVVGGPQYRVGSHRQFVQLARAMAAGGSVVLRFDCRGMGDSEGEPGGFEDLDADIDAALTALLAARPGLRGVVLCGLCDGASASLLYLDRRGPDARVTGLCLFNPWVRTAEGEATTRVRHYYLERLRSAAFWRKLLSGGVARGALREAMDAVAQALRRRKAAAGSAESDRLGAAGGHSGKGDGATVPHFTERMARAARAFGGPLLIVTSGRDYTAKEFLLATAADACWQHVMTRGATQWIDLPEADHTFSDRAEQRALERHCVAWLQGPCASPGPQAVAVAA